MRRPPLPPLTSFDQMAGFVQRAQELLTAATLRRLREAGVFLPSRAMAAPRILPWLAGRGPSLGLLSQLHAAAQPDKLALVDRHGALTWEEYDGRVNRVARSLEEMGVKPGQRVATLLRNGREHAEVILATQKLGVVAAPLNTWAKRAELEAVLERSPPAVLVYDTRHVEQLEGAVPDGVLQVAVGDPGDALEGAMAYQDLLDTATARAPSPITRDREPAKVIIHTSGTTGVPKAASRGTGGGQVAMLLSILRAVPYRHDEVVLLPAPMFHAFGLFTFAMTTGVGATILLPDRFDPEETLRWIDEHRATAVSLVPVMIRRILSLDEGARSRYDLSSLRILLASGSAMSPELRRRSMEFFGDVLYDLYGSTEAGWVAVASPDDIHRRPESVGKPVPGVEVVIFDDEGDGLPVGETGVIHVRSMARFEGYASGEEASERQGFLSIGDLGHLDDDGYLYVEGRADDMVVVGGENVYPAEIEEVIERLEGVEDVSVLGIPDEEYGEVLAAAVIGSVDPDEVRRACKEELASFKVPRRVEVVDELPRTSTGKVIRNELHDRLTAEEREG